MTYDEALPPPLPPRRKILVTVVVVVSTLHLLLLVGRSDVRVDLDFIAVGAPLALVLLAIPTRHTATSVLQTVVVLLLTIVAMGPVAVFFFVLLVLWLPYVVWH